MFPVCIILCNISGILHTWCERSVYRRLSVSSPPRVSVRMVVDICIAVTVLADVKSSKQTIWLKLSCHLATSWNAAAALILFLCVYGAVLSSQTNLSVESSFTLRMLHWRVSWIVIRGFILNADTAQSSLCVHLRDITNREMNGRRDWWCVLLNLSNPCAASSSFETVVSLDSSLTVAPWHFELFLLLLFYSVLLQQ
jgi:hypothetical protein